MISLFFSFFFLRKSNSTDTAEIVMLVPQAVSTVISMTNQTLPKILKSLDSDRLQVRLLILMNYFIDFVWVDLFT